MAGCEGDKQSRKKPGPPKPGPGRPKGVPNKTTALLKDAILQAAQDAGGREGLTGYLKQQAQDNPGPFMGLLGKVLPMQIQHDGAIKIERVDVKFVEGEE